MRSDTLGTSMTPTNDLSIAVAGIIWMKVVARIYTSKKVWLQMILDLKALAEIFQVGEGHPQKVYLICEISHVWPCFSPNGPKLCVCSVSET